MEDNPYTTCKHGSLMTKGLYKQAYLEADRRDKDGVRDFGRIDNPLLIFKLQQRRKIPSAKIAKQIRRLDG